MKPYFFPGIFISDELHNRLTGLFGSYMTIEPLNHEKRDNVEYLDNLILNQDKVSSFIREYRYITELNPDIPKENLKFMKENIYFKDDLSKSSIRSEISGDKKKSGKNPLLNSSIFLQLSYEFEMTDYLIESDLRKASENESKIFEKLKDQDFSLNHLSIKNDTRIEEKLQAWITLTNFSFKSNFFVATNPDIINIIIDDEDYDIYVIEDTGSLNGIISEDLLKNVVPVDFVNGDIANNCLIMYKIKKGPEKLFEGFISSLPQSATNISDHTIIGIIR